MNQRKFTVVDTDTQVTRIIESSATKVSELKRDLIAAGFSLENKTIQEGISGIEFKTDDAILPHDVPYNGTITNDLVFRLTRAEKHITSGSMSRPEAYAKIKKLNLAEEVKKAYGKNYTQCSTSDLIYIISKAEKKSTTTKVEKKEKGESKKELNLLLVESTDTSTEVERKDGNTANGLMELVITLVDRGFIPLSKGEQIAKIVGLELPSSLSDQVYSKSELDNMFKRMSK